MSGGDAAVEDKDYGRLLSGQGMQQEIKYFTGCLTCVIETDLTSISTHGAKIHPNNQLPPLQNPPY